MRRSFAISSAVVAAAATAVTISAAQASPEGHHRGSGADHSSRTITVVERAVSDTVIDIGPSGDSRGDLITFANPVYNASNTHKVGRDNGSCIRTVVGKAFECSWTTTLRGGSLMVQGPFYDTRDSVLAITGGTGVYSRARGEMHLHARDAESFTFTFKVQR